MMTPARRIAVVHGVPLGAGGLGTQSANAVDAFGTAAGELHVLGPPERSWYRSVPPQAVWHAAQGAPGLWRWPFVRGFSGLAQWNADVRLGRWAAGEIERIRPAVCYLFTQIALETLRRAHRLGVATVLDSPNGHIRDFRQVYLDEDAGLCDGRWRGHPTPRMVARVEEEYRLADRIRVSSEWAKASLAARGVDAARITVLQQPVDLEWFSPPPRPRLPGARLRVVFVGALDLRKGFVYLLRAARMLGQAVSLELVGGTVDRCTLRLLEREGAGLDMTLRPGDPRDAYRRADVSVLPTLEDGSPFAAAEAMASGLPLIVTDACGAREWVEPGRTGWIVAPRDPTAIAAALCEAMADRDRLAAMGLAARAATAHRANAAICHARLVDWALG